MEARRLPERDTLTSSLAKAVDLILSHQKEEGYWWYTLEANETIGAGFIQLMHFLGEVDPLLQEGLVRRILSQQRPDGSWPLFFGGPGDLSTTIECYFALRLAGHPANEEPLRRGRRFILKQGGLTKVRVFTRIHLALFGLVPWSACPVMPIWFVLLPHGLGVSIYEFCSWGRASIVPLLLVDTVRPVQEVPFDLNELFAEPTGRRHFRFPRPERFLSMQNFFIQFDKLLRLIRKLPWHPGRKSAIRKAEKWVREHIERTEDIYPAMAYAAIALKALGYPNSDPTIRKAVNGLKRFQQKCGNEVIHQQCCISPNWDTPWAGIALLEAGLDPKDERLLKAARYLISMEIRDFKGDWVHKNPKGPAGGWAFEFQNDFFPDVDDTLQILPFLQKVTLPPEEEEVKNQPRSGVEGEAPSGFAGGGGDASPCKEGPIGRGFSWLLSMQSRNGGWAAFDKDNTSRWVNKIPFSDHGACLDPPTPDITGRALEVLSLFGFTKDRPEIRRALEFLRKTQEPNGSWRGRWGVNYIYGTWCVLQGLAAIRKTGPVPSENFCLSASGRTIQKFPSGHPSSQKAANWLKSIQNPDGGWGESCLSDAQNTYVPLGVSVPSQTAWGVLGLIAAGEGDSPSVLRGVQWLIENQTDEGGWDEPWFTGTGFPGHFFIRYHGYRYYFPLLALGRYKKYR